MDGASTRLVVGLAVVLAGGCTPAQAPALRTSGKIMAIGGVAGIVGSALATRFTAHGAEMLLGCEVISAVGVGTYAYAELTYPYPNDREETAPERHHRWAKILTERASGAAREGRCARVRRLEPRVRTYDREVHDFVFMRDPEIVRCLSVPAGTELAPPRSESLEPRPLAPFEQRPAP